MILNKKVLNQPLFWFTIIISCYIFFVRLSTDKFTDTIRSDGRGYYAYLPALFIYNDGSYAKSAKVEKSYFPHGADQYYLFKNEKGKVYNKYFPGVSILQLPFFFLACISSWLLNLPIDGYSFMFNFCFYFGSLIYTLVGIFIFRKCLKMMFPFVLHLDWFVILFYISTPLMFYSLNTPSFSHLYSFFLFGLFTFQILKLKVEFKLSRILFLGLILGLIFLVRPTNCLIVFIIPFLISDKQRFIEVLKKTVELKNLILFFISFFVVLSILFFYWRWQSGDWIIWSYTGEGFNILRPQILKCLFSFRGGIFIHIPLMIVAFIGILIFYYKNRFGSIAWLLYFLINCWLISSWWCWDYESSFSNRAYTEHMFFLVIPALNLYEKYKKFTLIVLISFGLIGVIRYYERVTNFMGDQHFTSQNYFSSLQFWNNHNKARWNYTLSCIPFGKRISNNILLEDSQIHTINENDEFYFTVSDILKKPRTNERYYYRVELEKKTEEKYFEGVMLVIDASNSDFSKRYYKTVDLFNDRYEGKDKWVKLVFEGQILDNFQEYDQVKIYLWNQGKKRFKIRNCNIFLEEYKS